MSKIIKIEDNTISIVLDNGNIIEASIYDLNFRPVVGDIVTTYQKDNKIMIARVEKASSFFHKYYGELMTTWGLLVFPFVVFSCLLMYSELNSITGGMFTAVFWPVPILLGSPSMYLIVDLIRKLKTKGNINKLWHITALILHTLTALIVVGFAIIFFSLLAYGILKHLTVF